MLSASVSRAYSSNVGAQIVPHPDSRASPPPSDFPRQCLKEEA